MQIKMVDPIATDVTLRRYERLSRFYDRMEALQERRYHPWRKRLWSLVEGPRVLEIGVGTGKNVEYYPKGLDITAIDLTPGMLNRARHKASELNVPVDLRLGDAQALEFPDNSFDSAVGTFVFCSIPDPILGLSELRRVARPGGQILLLEHMRSANPIIGLLMDLINPLMAPVMGANMNRRTVENVVKSGLKIEFVEDLWAGGIFKLIAARVSYLYRIDGST